MPRDLRDSELYKEAEALYSRLRGPGTGQISDVAEIHAASDGRHAVFAGTIVEKLEGKLTTRICRTELATGETRVLTLGPHTDRAPQYSPDSRQIAFLSDRAKEGDFQLYLLDAATAAARPTAPVEGWVEYLHWSPDGSRILLAVAGHGADLAGGQGAVASRQRDGDLPSWIPQVETGQETFRWRRAWIYELATGEVHRIEAPSVNIWEGVWCGNDRIAAVVSPGPGESLWYSATLQLIDVATGKSQDLYRARDQLGLPAASPSGKHVAVVDALCSDRGYVAGDLILIETASGQAQRVDTAGVDVTCTEWRSDETLLVAGHRGFETVVGVYDLNQRAFRQTWASRAISTGGRYACVSGLNELGDCVLSGESFTRAPELATVRAGEYRCVRSFNLGYSEAAHAIASAAGITWQAPDGLEIQGWLLEPGGERPHALVLSVHGGPVWQYRPTWLGRSHIAILMLLARGYAILLSNPRGSAGRGQAFVRAEFGDAGGAETLDHLEGIDHLIAAGIADPNRLGVTGVSHGGYMTSWLIGQDARFAAAVAVSPVTNWVSEYLTSNIAHFCTMALGDRYTNATGKYLERSPIMYAHQVKTPTLNVCGALDCCTPPSEAVQFHNALLGNGVESYLVTYPQEGHGVRMFPAAIDFAARVVGWFVAHMR